jgi:hypothetical protein
MPLFQLEGKDVTMTQVGEGILLLPLKHSAEQLLSVLDSVDEAIGLERNQPIGNDSRNFE